MTDQETNAKDRRKRIAEAGLRVLARDGVRALTHRAIDREAGLAQGSTSYYAPTRRSLIELLVNLLADRSIADATQVSGAIGLATGGASGVTAEALATTIASLIDALAARPDDMRARYALLLELEPDDSLRLLLAQRSPVQDEMTDLLAGVLEQLGVAAPEDRATELFGLTDALLARRVITAVDSLSAEAVLSAYLRGVVR